MACTRCWHKICCAAQNHGTPTWDNFRGDKTRNNINPVCACYLLSCSFCIWERAGKTQATGWRRHGKTADIRADKAEMPQKMTATCHTRPQASLHKCKAAGINEGKQEHKNQVKNTNEYCSKNCWMEIVIDQRRSLEEAKQKKARAGCRNLSSTTTASKPKQADIIQCALSTSAWGRTPYKLLLLRCEVTLQRVNCHL